MHRIAPVIAHRNGVEIDGVFLDPLRLGPEELYRVTFTHVIGGVLREFLARAHDDMMEIGVVAIPDDGVLGVVHTGPFAFPFTGPLASIVVEECRVNGVAQRHFTAVIEVVFADEGGVVTIQFGDDGQVSFDDRVAAADGGVGLVAEVTFCPDRIRVDAAHNER